MRIVLLYWEEDEELAAALFRRVSDQADFSLELRRITKADLPLESFLANLSPGDGDCAILLWTQRCAATYAAQAEGGRFVPGGLPVAMLLTEDDFAADAIAEALGQGHTYFAGHPVAAGLLSRRWYKAEGDRSPHVALARLADAALRLADHLRSGVLREEAYRSRSAHSSGYEEPLQDDAGDDAEADGAAAESLPTEPEADQPLEPAYAAARPQPERLPDALADAIAARSEGAAVAPAADAIEGVGGASRTRSFMGPLMALALLGAGIAALLAILPELFRGFSIDAILPFFNSIAGTGGEGEDTDTPNAQLANCSVFAPPWLPVGKTILVQVFLHPPALEDQAERRARMADEAARPRGFTSLPVKLTEGEVVAFELRTPGLDVSDHGVGEIPWTGRVGSLQFFVTAPDHCEVGVHRATLVISTDGVPRGRLHFQIEVSNAETDAGEAEPRGDAARHYTKAFISYASEDRNEVLERVQMLGPFGIEVFQDILSLDPGDRWAQELYRNIDDSDLFFLFWSTHTRNSEWVIKEALYADDLRSRSPDEVPDIYPVLLEGPPPVPPPAALQHLHFNDRLLYFRR